MTFDVKNETIGHLYGTSIFRCIFFFLQSIPKKFQLSNVDRKRILRKISFCLYVDNSTCYVRFNSTMRRHWMTFLVEKCNIFLYNGHFFMQFSYFLWKSKVIVILWYMTKKTYFSHFIKLSTYKQKKIILKIRIWSTLHSWNFFGIDLKEKITTKNACPIQMSKQYVYNVLLTLRLVTQHLARRYCILCSLCYMLYYRIVCALCHVLYAMCCI
jgi:hypothetical protein